MFLIVLLQLWSLEKRRNRQDLIEVFKMAKGMTRIRLQELFMLRALEGIHLN